MCLIGIAYQIHPTYPLIILANRDEFYQRPTASVAWWEDYPEILAGRDLKAGGTWMGLSRKGRMAAITNFREPQNIKANAPSRGDLVKDFLIGSEKPESYMERLHKKAQAYNGFNLVLGTMDELYYYSNRGEEPRKLSKGLYGLSNHLLDTPWPKVKNLKNEMKGLLNNDGLDQQALLELMKNKELAPDAQLPSTGVSLEMERQLSAMFIEIPGYGTRVSSLLYMDGKGKARFIEKSYVPEGIEQFNIEFIN